MPRLRGQRRADAADQAARTPITSPCGPGSIVDGDDSSGFRANFAVLLPYAGGGGSKFRFKFLI